MIALPITPASQHASCRIRAERMNLQDNCISLSKLQGKRRPALRKPCPLAVRFTTNDNTIPELQAANS